MVAQIVVALGDVVLLAWHFNYRHLNEDKKYMLSDWRQPLFPHSFLLLPSTTLMMLVSWWWNVWNRNAMLWEQYPPTQWSPGNMWASKFGGLTMQRHYHVWFYYTPLDFDPFGIPSELFAMVELKKRSWSVSFTVFMNILAIWADALQSVDVA